MSLPEYLVKLMIGIAFSCLFAILTNDVASGIAVFVGWIIADIIGPFRKN